MPKILIIHGPNLNLLGSREPRVYGADTLDSINQLMIDKAGENQIEVKIFQSNHEGEIVEVIQNAAADKIDYILINPAAFTHTSVAIRDAFLATRIPFIELHLSNVHARDEFRKHSYLSDIATGVICGFGKNSYLMALDAVINQLKPSNSNET